MNVYQINDRVFRFELYNLNYFQHFDVEVISGHYTFWFDRKTRKYVFYKHGDYANLVSIRPVNETPRVPNDKEREFLDDLVMNGMKHAYFYNQDNPHCSMGGYLFDELETACDKRDGWGTEWFKHPHDEYYDNVMKTNCIFPVNYPGKDYSFDKKYWNKVKRNDKLATKLLLK